VDVRNAGVVEAARVHWRRLQADITQEVEEAIIKRIGAEISGRGDGDRLKEQWENMDDFSWQFVGATPSSKRCTMTNAQLLTAFQTYYGLPLDIVKVTTASQIPGSDEYWDEHGDNLLARWGLKNRVHTRRHDMLVLSLYKLAREARMDVRKEVRSLFIQVIQQAENVPDMNPEEEDEYRKKRNKAREGLRPDLIRRGPTANILYDVKTISKCKTWYRRTRNAQHGYATEKRAKKVPGEYRGKAKRVDTKYNEWAGPGKGPCESHLDDYTVIGLAFGAFGEVSKSVVNLVDQIASERAQRWRELGARDYNDAKSTSKELMRKTLGVEMMRGLAEAKKHLATMVARGLDPACDPEHRMTEDEYDEFLTANYNHSFGLGSDIGLPFDIGWP
jgi:hypothetical protein